MDLEMIKLSASILGAIFLSIYQIPQLTRIIKRKSSDDFSLPAYGFVWAGLLCYVVATWRTPANISAFVSFLNVNALIGVILKYRTRRRNAAT